MAPSQITEIASIIGPNDIAIMLKQCPSSVLFVLLLTQPLSAAAGPTVAYNNIPYLLIYLLTQAYHGHGLIYIRFFPIPFSIICRTKKIKFSPQTLG